MCAYIYIYICVCVYNRAILYIHICRVIRIYVWYMFVFHVYVFFTLTVEEYARTFMLRYSLLLSYKSTKKKLFFSYDATKRTICMYTYTYTLQTHYSRWKEARVHGLIIIK